MARGLKILAVAVLSGAMLAACGGGSTPGGSQPPDSTDGGSGGGTPGPVATTTGGGGGGGADDPCALLTADEVAGATGTTDPVTAAGTPGDPAKCVYSQADGTEVLQLDVFRSGAAAFFQSFVDAGSGETVSGLGDRAYYEPGTRRLLAVTGDVAIMLNPGPFVGDVDLNGMGQIVIARLNGGSAAQITAPPVVSAETACDLLSADEAAAVLGKGPVSASANEFAPQLCTYSVTSSGEVVAATFFQARGGFEGWSGYEANYSPEPIDGLGDKAFFDASNSVVFVLKGDSVFSVGVFGAAADDVLPLCRQLAEVMLGHL